MFRQNFATRIAPYVLGVFCAGFSVPALADDTRPAANQPNMAPNRDPLLGAGDERARGRLGTSNDFPGLEVKDWVSANVMATQTAAMFRRADSELGAAIRRTQAHFQHSKEYQEALTAQQQGYSDYLAAREKALASLQSDTQYTETIRLRDQVGARLSARRADRSASHEELLAMAELKMQYASDARAIEIKAIDRNADVKAAHDRMVTNGRKVIDMQVAFDDSLHDNAEIAQYRNNLENARIAMLAADTYRVASAFAADASFYYSIFLHRNDQGYYAPYGPAAVSVSGAGGYYSPYWGR